MCSGWLRGLVTQQRLCSIQSSFGCGSYAVSPTWSKISDTGRPRGKGCVSSPLSRKTDPRQQTRPQPSLCGRADKSRARSGRDFRGGVTTPGKENAALSDTNGQEWYRKDNAEQTLRPFDMIYRARSIKLQGVYPSAKIAAASRQRFVGPPARG